MAILKRWLANIARRREVPPLGTTVEALEEWFETPFGQALLADEQRVLDEELSCLFGYHLMQLSVLRTTSLYRTSRVRHCFSVGVGDPSPNLSVGVFSALESLPLADESVDVTLLHHVLEFSKSPHHVLKEASRVTIPKGYIVILGFNPFSPLGAIKPLAQLCSSSPIWKHNSLRKSRVSDWLQFLDCNTMLARTGSYSVPLKQRQGWLGNGRRLSHWCQRWGLPFGNFYCVIARKDVAGLTPIRPVWEREQVLPGVAVPKRTLSVRPAARTKSLDVVK